jgi:DNA replication protein DnaC
MKLTAMADCYQTLSKDENFPKMSVDSILLSMCQSEWEHRESKRIDSAIRKAKVPFKYAHYTDLSHCLARRIDDIYLQRLSHCEWIPSSQNIIFTGDSGTGKSWLACMFANHAIKLGYSVKFYDLPDLLREVEESRLLPLINGLSPLIRLKKSIEKLELLIIDGLGMTGLSQQQCEDLEMVIKLRDGIGSTIVTSPLGVELWSDFFAGLPMSQSVIDRLVSKGHLFKLYGTSLRSEFNEFKGDGNEH